MTDGADEDSPVAPPLPERETATPSPVGTKASGLFEISQTHIRNAYDLLSILDSKASALLMFNALVLTALSVWLNNIPLNFMHFILDLAFLIILASCVLALRIVRLKWAQLGDDQDSLNKLRDKRTAPYQKAWWSSVVAVTVLICASTVHTVGTLVEMRGLCTGWCQTLFSDEVLGNLDAGSHDD